MNDLSETLGLMRREIRDCRAIASNVDGRVRDIHRTLDPAAFKGRPTGSLVARFATVTAMASAGKRLPEDVARQSFSKDTDLARLITTRAASGPATTTGAGWAADLVAIMVADIADTLLPESALMQLRRLGLSYDFVDGAIIKVPIHTPVPSGAWILEGSPIPVGALLLSSLTLKPKKVGDIVAVTREMLQGSPVNVEKSLGALLSDNIGLKVDTTLVSSAAATAAAPAGLLNGVTPLTATAGGGTNALLGDIKALLNAIAPSIRPVLIANSTQAASINTLAQVSLPVIVAPSLTAGTVIALDAAAFASSLGAIDFGASEEATLHMEDTNPLPIATGVQGSGVVATPTSSMFQMALTALRFLLDCDWALRRTGAVAVVTGATW